MSSLSRTFARESKRGKKLMEQYQGPGTYEWAEKKYREALAERRGRRKEVVHLPLDEPRMDFGQVDVREGKPRHMVAIF